MVGLLFLLTFGLGSEIVASSSKMLCDGKKIAHSNFHRIQVARATWTSSAERRVDSSVTQTAIANWGGFMPRDMLSFVLRHIIEPTRVCRQKTYAKDKSDQTSGEIPLGYSTRAPTQGRRASCLQKMEEKFKVPLLEGRPFGGPQARQVLGREITHRSHNE